MSENLVTIARRICLLLPLVPAWLAGQEPSAEYRIGSGQASPGDTITLPFFVKTTVFRMQGFSYSIDFDEEVLEGVTIDRAYQIPGGSDWWYHRNVFNNANDTPGNGGIDEGYLAGGNVFILGTKPVESLPPLDVENEILRVTFRVKPDAPAGETELRFLEGGKAHPDSPGVDNTVTLNLQSETPDQKISAVTIGAVLKIVPEPDVTLFLRGDSNSDWTVDVSDAVMTLRYLFLGDRRPSCMDAADANDDGRVNITDPVVTLRFLFIDRSSLAQPIQIPGPDPTPDELGCEGLADA